MKPGFLSLDLYALEKMLEKVDVHERLYIHADLLPPEMVSFTRSKTILATVYNA